MLRITDKIEQLKYEAFLAILLLEESQKDLKKFPGVGNEKSQDWHMKMVERFEKHVSFKALQEDFRWIINPIFGKVFVGEISTEQAEKLIETAIEELQIINDKVNSN